MEPPPPPPPSPSTAESRNSKGKSIQLIDREPSKASSSRGVSFESDCELNELIDKEPSKASSSIGVSLESDCELNELIDNEPSEVISLFSDIEPGDPVDEVLKSTVSVIKDSGQIDNEIRIFKSYQRRFPAESQESLDNVLIDLYKDISNSTDSLFMKAKYAAEKEKDLEKARILYYGVLKLKDRSFDTAVKNWDLQYMVSKSLSLEPDKNNQCNLAICFMNSGRISEAKSLLQTVTPSSNEQEIADSYIKSFDRAWKMLTEFDHGDI